MLVLHIKKNKTSDQQRQVPVVCHQHESILNSCKDRGITYHFLQNITLMAFHNTIPYLQCSVFRLHILHKLLMLCID